MGAGDPMCSGGAMVCGDTMGCCDAMCGGDLMGGSDRSATPLVEDTWVPDPTDIGFVIPGCGSPHREGMR